MLETTSYCPTLHARVAEIKALQQLPNVSKDQILPIIIARPWPNAKSLTKTWEKIEGAVGTRRFGLDLDRTKYRNASSTAAGLQFDALFNPSDGYSAYYEQVAELSSAIPVLRVNSGGAEALARQLDHVEDLERGLIVRVEHGILPAASQLVDDVIARFPDAVFLIDSGWSSDLLGLELWASGLITRISADNPDAEIIVSGSSFPDKFAGMGVRKLIPVVERQLYSSLVRRHNAATLIYGDWASTRPPLEPTPMKNVARIDLPTNGEWCCFREDEDEAYREIAERVIADSLWPSGLAIWGTYTIECTAAGLNGAIRSPGTAAAVRINIHMHRQAQFGVGGEVSDGEEPFTD